MFYPPLGGTTHVRKILFSQWGGFPLTWSKSFPPWTGFPLVKKWFFPPRDGLPLVRKMSFCAKGWSSAYKENVFSSMGWFAVNEEKAKWVMQRAIYVRQIGWHDKPLIMGYPDSLTASEEDREMASYFTFRPAQPDYVAGPTRSDQWSWLEVYPQHGFARKEGGRFEQVIKQPDGMVMISS